MKKASCLKQHILFFFISLSLILTISFFITPAKSYAIEVPQTDKAFFDLINPLTISGSSKVDELSKPAGIINELLKILFPAAVLILFAMLSWGGFEMLTGAANEKNLTAGKSRITSAVVGFILLFCSFWIIRIVETIFKITILG